MPAEDCLPVMNACQLRSAVGKRGSGAERSAYWPLPALEHCVAGGRALVEVQIESVVVRRSHIDH